MCVQIKGMYYSNLGVRVCLCACVCVCVYVRACVLVPLGMCIHNM